MNGLQPRLRERRLTEKPRIITTYSGAYWVERMSEHGPLVERKETFAEAVTLANEWASQKVETPC